MRTSRIAVTLAAIAAAPALLLASPALAADAAPAPASAVADDPNDLRVAIVQLMSRKEAGTEVRERGKKALNGTIEEMRAFLETGYRLAQAQDDRVALAQLISNPRTTAAVKATARKVLSAGNPEEMRWFLKTGQYQVTG